MLVYTTIGALCGARDYHVDRGQALSPARSSTAVLVGLALVSVVAAAAVSINAGENPKSIRIIYTNDMQGYVEPCG